MSMAIMFDHKLHLCYYVIVVRADHKCLAHESGVIS